MFCRILQLQIHSWFFKPILKFGVGGGGCLQLGLTDTLILHVTPYWPHAIFPDHITTSLVRNYQHKLTAFTNQVNLLTITKVHPMKTSNLSAKVLWWAAAFLSHYFPMETFSSWKHKFHPHKIFKMTFVILTEPQQFHELCEVCSRWGIVCICRLWWSGVVPIVIFLCVYFVTFCIFCDMRYFISLLFSTCHVLKQNNQTCHRIEGVTRYIIIE